MKALQQLLHEVEWGGLDVLVLDLPPGTGDVQLSIAQQVVVDGQYLSTLRDFELQLCMAVESELADRVSRRGCGVDAARSCAQRRC